MAQQPSAGAAEQQAVQQREALLAVRRPSPTQVCALDQFEIGKEGVLLLEPSGEGRPGLEQRFVRDFDDGFSVLSARGEQTRLDQRTDKAVGFRRQVRTPGRLADALGIIEPQPYEMRHEGVAQRVELPLRGFARKSTDRLVGGVPHRILYRIQPARRVAQR